MLENMPTVETIFVIGGEMVYQQAIKDQKCSKIYLNKVHVVCDLTNSDTFFPAVDTNIYDLIEERHDDPTVSNYVYVRKPCV
jgi:dihydrofolate reductase